MPKRSNEFQRLIAWIYECVTPQTGKVTEPGMVYDKDADILREVDILIEYKFAGHDSKLIVECRDRSRSETVEWIDSVIGKTIAMDVNKIIAVSSKGFAKAAIKKAKAKGIETLTLEEAIETDWKNYPIKPGVAIATDENFEVKDILFLSGDKYVSFNEIGFEVDIYYEGEVVGSGKDLCEYLYLEKILPLIQKHIRENRMEIFKVKEDLEKILTLDYEMEIPEICFTCQDKKISTNRLKFIVHGTRLIETVSVNHKKFNKLMVSSGNHIDRFGKNLNFKLVQDSEAKKMFVSLNPKN
jgi:hypothetical protein